MFVIRTFLFFRKALHSYQSDGETRHFEEQLKELKKFIWEKTGDQASKGLKNKDGSPCVQREMSEKEKLYWDALFLINMRGVSVPEHVMQDPENYQDELRKIRRDQDDPEKDEWIRNEVEGIENEKGIISYGKNPRSSEEE